MTSMERLQKRIKQLEKAIEEHKNWLLENNSVEPEPEDKKLWSVLEVNF